MDVTKYKDNSLVIQTIINNLRAEGDTLEEISDTLGYSRQQIGKWSKGHNIRRHTLATVSKILKIKLDFDPDGGSRSRLKTRKEKPLSMSTDIKDRILENQLVQINELKDKVDQLEKNEQSFQPHPEAFEEMAKLLENITKQWHWTFYHSPNPMSCSRNGKVKSINPQLERALGWTEKEMIGSDILDFIHKDDLEKTKKALTQKDRNLTVRIKKKNGNHCTMHVKAKEFGIDSKKYSNAIMTCLDKGCSDCDGLKAD